MRVLLAAVAVAGATLSVAPAQAQYLVSSCNDGDWQVVEVSSGGTELIEVCTNAVRPPTLSYCVLHPLDPQCVRPEGV